MTVIVVAEKRSAAKNFADALGGSKGTYKGTKYEVVSLSGHLYELVHPHEMLKDPSKREEIRVWDLDTLPWDPNQFTWKRKMGRGQSSLISSLRKRLQAKDVTEIVNGADLDPTGEGDLLFWEVMDELNLHHKKFTRMEFVDESVKSLRTAFENRRPIKSMMDEGGFRKADARSKMDLLTMQHTRLASLSSQQGTVLRQGRLKSAMVNLVVDQYEAWKNYKKVPFFQNRFQDENDVVYTDPNEPQYPTKGEVPKSYTDSPVELVSKTDKRTAPPKLLDLAGLSARLSSQGVKAQQVLSVYQKMYEAKIVSYPRTEDRTITNEQFKELLPLAPRIANAVGVDPALLTHQSPRKSHVRDSGAHGANRPGPNVPASMETLAAQYGPIAPKIYMILARNYLAMLAPDYLYENQKGRVVKYPNFVGSANVPKSLGWRAVFDADDDLETSKGIGKHAKPFIYEGANPRPQHPTMRWLMAQLEKHNVGTGATRTSIYADTISQKHRYPLLSEERGRITPTQYGLQSHRLLVDTHIGDLKATEAFYDMMARIEKGNATLGDALEMVTNWVREDKQIMKHNGASMRKEFSLSTEKEKVAGTFNGEVVKFSRVWGGHRFTDEEVADLLDGKEISFEAQSKAGNNYTAKGKLEAQEFTTDDGRVIEFFGFKLDTSGFGKKAGSGGADSERVSGTWNSPEGPREVSLKKTWGQYKFTDDEMQKLLSGERITINTVSKAGNPLEVTGELADQTFTTGDGKEVAFTGFKPDWEVIPYVYMGVELTPDQRKTLENGGKVFLQGLTSSKGNTFDATVFYGYKKDGTKGMNLEFA